MATEDAPLRSCPACGRLSRGAARCPNCGGPLAAGLFGARPRILLPPLWLTSAIIIFCAVMFAASLGMDLWLRKHYPVPAESNFLSLVWNGSPRANVALGSAYAGFLVAPGGWWRWLTACFLHFGILHIALNCYAFLDLGRVVETLWGKRRLWTACILSGIAGNAFSFAWRILRPYAWERWILGDFDGAMSPARYLELNPDLLYNAAGASGFVCGLVGWLLAAWRRDHGIPANVGRSLLRWAGIMVVFGLVVPGIDNGAHFGGGAAGFVLGWWAKPRNRIRPGSMSGRVWAALAVFSSLLFVAAYAALLVFLIAHIFN